VRSCLCFTPFWAAENVHPSLGLQGPSELRTCTFTARSLKASVLQLIWNRFTSERVFTSTETQKFVCVRCFHLACHQQFTQLVWSEASGACWRQHSAVTPNIPLTHKQHTQTHLHAQWALSCFSRTMLCLIKVVMWTKAAVLSTTADLQALQSRREAS